ncbi:MAG TPA: serine/threonine protein kinase [Blastocatellia bacterium]|nr:serine/threonine protein kinase [Blastocatellia bacterium]
MAELRLENSIVDDRYRVERCLGRGSYAEVFLAYDRTGEAVIIKALNTTLQGTLDPELEWTLVENFQNEAIALDKVRHPNIIRRLGHGTAADLEGVPFHYLVLEYMAGGDLQSFCRRKPLGLSDALFYFQQVAEALAYAHSRQVIHRDIKPNNLLLSADHRIIKIADFGVAKIAHQATDEITRVGTNVYAPPEHHPDSASGPLDEQLTSSADVYSFAKTIYTAMTGRAPHKFSRQPITELPPEIAGEPWANDLLAVLCKATASRVAARYESVQEFWEDFARLNDYLLRAESADPEATHVRPRLSGAAPAIRAAAKPDFHTLALGSPGAVNTRKARIVVELPQNLKRQAVEVGTAQPAPVEVARPEAPVKAEAASPSKAKRMEEQDPGPGFFDSLRAIIKAEWLRRVFIVFLVCAFIGLAASTYYEFANRRARPSQPHSALHSREGLIAYADGVNLRREPGGSVLAEMPRGTRVRVVDSNGNWVKVRVLQWAGDEPPNAPDSGWMDYRFFQPD